MMCSREQLIALKVRPRSSRAGLEIGSDGGLVVRVHAPPAGGAANRECLALVARALGLPSSAVSIARGAKSRGKLIEVEGLPTEEARSRLHAAAREGRGS